MNGVNQIIYYNENNGKVLENIYSFHINFNKQNYGNKQKSDTYHK